MDAHTGDFTGNNVSMCKVLSEQIEFSSIEILQVKAVLDTPKASEDPSVWVFVDGDCQ